MIKKLKRDVERWENYSSRVVRNNVVIYNCEPQVESLKVKGLKRFVNETFRENVNERVVLCHIFWMYLH